LSKHGRLSEPDAQPPGYRHSGALARELLDDLAILAGQTARPNWRTTHSGRDLLGLALIGGSPGALLARKLFRHKTRKEPFSTQLLAIIALQAGTVIGLAIAFA